MSDKIITLDSLDLEPGMEIAADVLNKQGNMIIKKGTILNTKLINSLISMDIKYIAILDTREDGDQSPLIDETLFFQQLFLECYDEQAVKAAEEISHILKGGNIDADQLFAISEDVIRNLKNSEDVFKYISDLDSSYNGIYTHSLNVALICHLFAIWLNYQEEKRKELVTAGLLHDIGKIISEEEYENHPILGAKYLVEHGASKAVQLGVLMHHEKEDGSGFPTRARWEHIHNYAKIISIANYYDNSTTGGKTLQNKICPFQLIRIFENERYGIFDIEYMDIFLSKIANYYLGEQVKLIDGRVGKIVFINKHCFSRPIVLIGEELLNLYYEKDLEIKEII